MSERIKFWDTNVETETLLYSMAFEIVKSFDLPVFSEKEEREKVSQKAVDQAYKIAEELLRQKLERQK